MPAGIGPDELALKIPKVESTLLRCKSFDRCDCDVKTLTIIVVGPPVDSPSRTVSSAVEGGMMELPQTFPNFTTTSLSDVDDSLIRRLRVTGRRLSEFC